MDKTTVDQGQEYRKIKPNSQYIEDNTIATEYKTSKSMTRPLKSKGKTSVNRGQG
jgi:hypothetical protein